MILDLKDSLEETLEHCVENSIAISKLLKIDVNLNYRGTAIDISHTMKPEEVIKEWKHKRIRVRGLKNEVKLF